MEDDYLFVIKEKDDLIRRLEVEVENLKSALEEVRDELAYIDRASSDANSIINKYI